MPAPASPGAMFAQRLSPHPTMGARTCTGSYAASTRPEAYAMTIRRSTVEQVFGTLKHWMGATHFLTRTLGRVSSEMSLQVLAYNIKRVMNRVTMDQPVGAVKATLGGYF